MFLIILGTYLRVEFLGYMVTLFSFLRNFQTISRTSFTILHSHQ